VLQVEGTLSDPDIYRRRTRICDLGALRQLYRREDGTIGYRCPAEPVDQYMRKGGKLEETEGRKCICNALFATIGLGQLQHPDDAEPAIITSGDHVQHISRFLRPGSTRYSAADVVRYLLGN
jgi:hypothetical protein